MNLFGWTCPECDEYHRHVDGQRIDGNLSIRCTACGAIDRIRPKRPTPEVTP